MVIYLAPVLGIAWQVDARRRRLVVVVSSRTEWPALEHARALREMILADLESRGWVRYHAGAVAAGDRGILVLGPPGSGKTTLIVSLLRLGGHYVANDRTLVSVTGRGVQARNFPLPAAVGLARPRGSPSYART